MGEFIISEICDKVAVESFDTVNHENTTNKMERNMLLVRRISRIESIFFNSMEKAKQSRLIGAYDCPRSGSTSNLFLFRLEGRKRGSAATKFSQIFGHGPYGMCETQSFVF